MGKMFQAREPATEKAAMSIAAQHEGIASAGAIKCSVQVIICQRKKRMWKWHKYLINLHVDPLDQNTGRCDQLEQCMSRIVYNDGRLVLSFPLILQINSLRN